MADTHTSDTLTGGPKQGKHNEINRHATPERKGKDTGITNRGSGVGRSEYGSTSHAAGLDRHRTVRRDEDERMKAMVENERDESNATITHGEGAKESRNIPMSSAASGTKNTTTGPGEAGHNPEPERKGNIYDPEHPDPNSNPKIE